MIEKKREDIKVRKWENRQQDKKKEKKTKAERKKGRCEGKLVTEKKKKIT